jgi:hypothetical protein
MGQSCEGPGDRRLTEVGRAYERDPQACRDPGFGRGLIEHNAGLPPRQYPSWRLCPGERRRPQGDGVKYRRTVGRDPEARNNLPVGGCLEGACVVVTDSECFRSAAAVRGYAVAGHSGPHGPCKCGSTMV